MVCGYNFNRVVQIREKCHCRRTFAIAKKINLLKPTAIFNHPKIKSTLGLQNNCFPSGLEDAMLPNERALEMHHYVMNKIMSWKDCSALSLL